jgi:hypothetical protein
MTYIGTLTYDYSGQDTNARNLLTNALAQAGWSYSGRTAMVLDSETLEEFRRGLEVLARILETPGTLTALSMQIQKVGEARRPPAYASNRRAYTKALESALPSVEAARRRADKAIADLEKTSFDLPEFP